MHTVYDQKEKESFADLLDDNLSQILLITEKMKHDAWSSKDKKSMEDLSEISTLISKLYDARVELAENLVELKN